MWTLCQIKTTILLSINSIIQLFFFIVDLYFSSIAFHEFTVLQLNIYCYVAKNMWIILIKKKYFCLSHESWFMMNNLKLINKHITLFS